MARKSRATIWKECLAKVSECSPDIFDLFPPDDSLIATFSEAEKGDRDSLLKILSKIKDLVTTPEGAEEARIHKNEALVYWLTRGADTNDAEIAGAVIAIALSVGYGFEHAERALGVIDDKELTSRVLTARVIEAAEAGADIDTLSPMLAYLDKDNHADVLCFAGAMCGRCDAGALAILGLSSLSALPIFGGSGKGTIDSTAALALLSIIENISRKYYYAGWADFWLRCMYELSITFSCNLTPVARYAAEVSLGRHFAARKNLHALVWLRYLAEHSPVDDAAKLSEAIKELEDSCRFDLILNEELTPEEEEALRKEAIYTRYTEERARHEREASLGNKILHERNRYLLAATLTNHSKRGRRHYWETTVSLPLDTDEVFLPEFDSLTAERAHNVITRGGVTLSRDKGASQMILTSEISIRGVKAPLTVDLILDIAYISAVKCGEGEIKIKDFKVQDGYLVMSCQIFLF